MEIGISRRKFFVNTVGLNTKVVEDYIRNQEKEDRFKIIYQRKNMLTHLRGNQRNN